MRFGPALILGLVLAVTPAYAQGKTKTTAAEQAVAALEVCETFAKGDVLAVEAALEAGWDAYDEEAESPFIRQYGGSRDIPALGWGDLFILIETYPDRTLGYCRMDVAEPTGEAETVIEAIAALDRYEGNVKTDDAGSYASLAGTDGNSLLLTHWDDLGLVLQLTIVTPKTAAAGEQ